MVWAGVATVGWAVWGVTLARASTHGGAAAVTAGMLLVEALVFVWAWPKVTAAFSWWMVLAGLASAGAYLALTRSLQVGGDPGIVFALTALYPALIVLWLWLAQGEGLTARQVVGVVLAVTAAILLAK
jgi:uncharacterized membrane protein